MKELTIKILATFLALELAALALLYGWHVRSADL